MSTPKQFVEHYKRKLERCMDDENVVLDTIHKLGKVPLPSDVLQKSGVYELMKDIRKKEGKVGYEALNLVSKWKSVILAAKGSEPLPAKAIDKAMNQNSEIRSSNTPLNFVNKLPVTSNHNSNWEKVCFQSNPVNKWDKNDSLCSVGIPYESEQRSRSNSFNSHQENHLKISHNSDLDFCDSHSQSSNVHLITKDTEDQSMNETSQYAKKQIIAPYSIDLKEGMFRAVKIKSEKPSRLSILKDYCSQEELVNCEIDYCSNSDYKKIIPSKKDTNKVDDSKKGLNSVHKKEREKCNLDKPKLLNSSLKQEKDVEKDSKLLKKGFEKNMIERDKTPVKSDTQKHVKSEKDKTPLKKDKAHVKFEKDKAHVKSEQDKTPVKLDKDKTPVKSDTEKIHVKSEKDKTPLKKDKAHVKFEKDKAHVKSEQNKTPVKLDKDKTPVKSDKDKISVKSDKEKIPLKSDREKISLKPEKEKSSVKSDKPKMSVKPEKEKMSVKSDNDKIPVSSGKRKRESEYSDIVKNGKIKAFHNSSTESPNCSNGMKWKLHQVEVASSGETTHSETHPNENGKSAKKRELSDDEGAVFLLHKKERTSVYSGKKSSPAVLSLKEYCIHTLKKNIDSIRNLRKVPYNVIQPVLQCCAPSQLINLENHNKYLMDHTSELWKKICQKHYKDEVPQKHETWRSVYMRVNKGKEKKLKGIIASIAASKSKSQPERQLKLADAHVKYSHGNNKLIKNTTANAGSPSFASSKVSSPLSAFKNSPSTSTAKVITDSHIKYSYNNNKLTKGAVYSSSPSVSSPKVSPPVSVPSVSSSKVSPSVSAPSVSASKTSPPMSTAKVSKPPKKHKKATEAPLMSKVKKSMGLYKQK